MPIEGISRFQEFGLASGPQGFQSFDCFSFEKFRLFFVLRHMIKEIVKLEGEIIENLPSTTFKVKLDNNHEILAHISGRMRVNYIRLIPGDRVLVEMSPYDLTKGRIVQRLK